MLNYKRHMAGKQPEWQQPHEAERCTSHVDVMETEDQERKETGDSRVNHHMHKEETYPHDPVDVGARKGYKHKRDQVC